MNWDKLQNQRYYAKKLNSQDWLTSDLEHCHRFGVTEKKVSDGKPSIKKNQRIKYNAINDNGLK